MRTLFITVLILSLPFSWVSMRMRQSQEEKRTVAWIEQLGGSVHYDVPQKIVGTAADSGLGGEWMIDEEPRRTNWLRSLLGDHFFDHVDCAYLSGLHVKDISQLSSLHDLAELNVTHSCVHDISALAGLHKLRYLSLFDSEVHDISILSELTELRTLILMRTPVGDSQEVP